MTEINFPRFQGDDGSADPHLRELLGDPEPITNQRDIVNTLVAGRVLIPVVAVLDSGDEDGGDKDSHMATVRVVDAEGRAALLAFTGSDSLATWREDARPVAVSGVEAAQSALSEDCVALLIDVAGPQRYAVAGTGLWALAAGGPWRHPLDEPVIVAAMDEVAADCGVDVTWVAAPETIDGVTALVPPGVEATALEDLATRLGQLEAVRARVSSLQIGIS